jgi:hypothetical protein
MKLLAAEDINKALGTINPPAGTPGDPSDPTGGLGKVLSVSISLVLFVAGLMLLIYLLWGGFDWITSNGEKEKLTKAQNKILNAVIGMVMVIVAFVLFAVINSAVLGNKIIDTSGPVWQFNIPTTN